ncbi:hypothetical protein B0H15DRAFT_991662 [Mycena belliarum]|uniref:Uncharacterized protein n=1 Tax=Mycena belliarum TaxID=1033014 RepID=A0AAD6XWU7_9AGAR|nr:hypothetical protein B0H15DRAFT_991662 [Mycena belliae]
MRDSGPSTSSERLLDSECLPALLVYAEPGSDMSPQEFDTWFAQEPLAGEDARTLRYRAIDGQKPTWLAICESASISPESLGAGAPPSAAPPGLSMHTRTAYTPRGCRTHARCAPADIPAPILYTLRVTLAPEVDSAFEAWYSGSHTDGFARVPGWRRMRRYVLHAHSDVAAPRDAVERRNTVDRQEGSGDGGESPSRPYRHLAVHEWSHAAFADMPEYAALVDTLDGVTLKKSLRAFEMRVFELYPPRTS